MYIVFCNAGGEFVLKRNKFHYQGGETRMLVIEEGIGYLDLLSKLKRICGTQSEDISVKYRYVGSEQDDPLVLVSVRNDDDIRHTIMLHNLHHTSSSMSPLHIFLFENLENPSIPTSTTNPSLLRKEDDAYVDLKGVSGIAKARIERNAPCEVQNIMDEFKSVYGYHVDNNKAWKGRNIALKELGLIVDDQKKENITIEKMQEKKEYEKPTCGKMEEKKEEISRKERTKNNKNEINFNAEEEKEMEDSTNEKKKDEEAKEMKGNINEKKDEEAKEMKGNINEKKDEEKEERKDVNVGEEEEMKEKKNEDKNTDGKNKKGKEGNTTEKKDETTDENYQKLKKKKKKKKLLQKNGDAKTDEKMEEKKEKIFKKDTNDQEARKRMHTYEKKKEKKEDNTADKKEGKKYEKKEEDKTYKKEGKKYEKKDENKADKKESKKYEKKEDQKKADKEDIDELVKAYKAYNPHSVDYIPPGYGSNMVNGPLVPPPPPSLPGSDLHKLQKDVSGIRDFLEEFRLIVFILLLVILLFLLVHYQIHKC